MNNTENMPNQDSTNMEPMRNNAGTATMQNDAMATHSGQVQAPTQTVQGSTTSMMDANKSVRKYITVSDVYKIICIVFVSLATILFLVGGAVAASGINPTTAGTVHNFNNGLVIFIFGVFLLGIGLTLWLISLYKDRKH